MGNLTIMLGLGIVGFILTYIMFQLRDDTREHYLLQLLLLFLVSSTLVLVAKVSTDDQNFCEWLTNQTQENTTLQNYSVTDYTYTYECRTNPNNTADTFYWSTIWAWRLLNLYIFIYFTYEAIKYLMNRWKRK